MRQTIVQLERTSDGCPEQWEGKLSSGQDDYARERHGTVRVEVDGITVLERAGDSALDALAEMFDIAPYTDGRP